METDAAHRVKGIADYEARWIGRSYLVRLSAQGLLPCSNYHAQLERGPERVIPPIWNMVFYIEDLCEKGLKFFEIDAVMLNTVGAKTVVVRDAVGEHEVPILPALGARAPDTALSLDTRDSYVVYAKLPKQEEGCVGCIVVPEGAIVSTIHYRAFGPAPKADCDAFVAENCRRQSADFGFRAGEIPWPMLTEG